MGLVLPLTTRETEASSHSFLTVTFVSSPYCFASYLAVWLGEGKRNEPQKKSKAELADGAFDSTMLELPWSSS